MFDQATGKSKKVQKYLRTTDEEEARRKKKDFDSKYSKLARKSSKQHLALLIQVGQYIENRASKVRIGTLSKETLRTDAGVLGFFAREMRSQYGNVLIGEIRKSHITSYSTMGLKNGWLKEDGSRGKPLAPSTVALHLRHLKAFFSHLKHVAPDNPVKDVDIPSQAKRSSSAIPLSADWDKLCSRLETEAREEVTDVPVCLLFALVKTGTRIGELRMLKWNTTERHEKLRNHSQSYSILSPDFSRLIILSKRVSREPLVTHLSWLFQKLHDRIPRSESFVFGNPETNKPFDYKTISKRLDSVKQELSLSPSITLHSLRHGFISEMVRRTNGNLSLVGEYVGHKTQWMTENYKHIIDEEEKTFVNLIR